MRSQGRFREVLRRPGVPTVLLPYVLSRLSATMVVLSVLLYGQDQTGSFATAGVLSAAFAGSAAVVAPVLGRLVDSRGQWPVLASCALTQPLALVALVLFLRNDRTPYAVIAAGLAGACMPPVTACMRALWTRLVDEEDLMVTAWSIEGLLVEATELGGPLAAGLLVLLVDPVAAVLVAAGLSYTGAMLFALSSASHGWRTQRRTARAGHRSPLALRGVRSLVCVVFVSTAGLAALEISIAAFAAGRGQPGATGLLFAVWLGASLVGGWFYGSRTWRVAPERQLPLLLAACGATALAPLLAQGFLSMGLLLAVAGLAIAPAAAAQFAVMAHVAPERHRTEAFTWGSTAGFLGVAAGASITGAVIEWLGSPAGIMLSSLFGLAAAALALVSARAFEPAPLQVVAARPLMADQRIPIDRRRRAEQPLTG